MDLGIFLSKREGGGWGEGGNEELIAYTNSDYARDVDDRKVLLDMCFYSVKKLCHGPLKSNMWLFY